MKTARILTAATAVLALAACQATPTSAVLESGTLAPVFDGSTTPTDTTCALCGGQMMGSGG